MSRVYTSKMFQFGAITVVSSLCLLLNSLTRISFSRVELPKDRPEYKAKGVGVSVFNKSGKLLYNLTSETAWEYPSDDKVYMHNLDIKMYSESSDIAKYNILSYDGWVNYSKKQGYLGESTVITINEITPEKITRIYGNQINLDMNTNTITSNDDVVAKQGKSMVYSHGFSYDTDKKFLKLNSNVKVIYEK